MAAGRRHDAEFGGRLRDVDGERRAARVTSMRKNRWATYLIASVAIVILVFGSYQSALLVTTAQTATLPPALAEFSARVAAEPAALRAGAIATGSHGRRCTAAQAAAIAELRPLSSSNCPSTYRWMPKFVAASARSARPARLVSIGCNTASDLVSRMRTWSNNDTYSVTKLRQAQGVTLHGSSGVCKDDHKKEGNRTDDPVRRVEAWCVEPMPSNIRMVNKTIAACGYSEAIRLVHAAASSTIGFSLFPFGVAGQEDKGLKIDGTISAEPLAAQGVGTNEHSVSVAVTTVDELLGPVASEEGWGVGAIDELSIDTEGNDMRVVFGAVGILARRLVRFLEFEYHEVGQWAQSSLEDVVELLDNLGFDCYFMGNDGDLFRLTGCWHASYSDRAWSNIGCAHRAEVALAGAMEKTFNDMMKCAPPSAGACLENGIVDDDCCIIDGSAATCAKGYRKSSERDTVCWHNGGDDIAKATAVAHKVCCEALDGHVVSRPRPSVTRAIGRAADGALIYDNAGQGKLVASLGGSVGALRVSMPAVTKEQRANSAMVGCLPASANHGVCLEDGRADNDCCAVGVTGTCAEGYEGGPTERVCWHDGGGSVDMATVWAYEVCCKERGTAPSSAGPVALASASGAGSSVGTTMAAASSVAISTVDDGTKPQGCLPPSAGACLEDRRSDNDCCAVGVGSCAAGYVQRPGTQHATICWHNGGATLESATLMAYLVCCDRPNSSLTRLSNSPTYDWRPQSPSPPQTAVAATMDTQHAIDTATPKMAASDVGSKSDEDQTAAVPTSRAAGGLTWLGR